MDNENTIQILKGAERVRRRPAVIFGSAGVDGCAAAFLEFFNNSLAEAKGGFADRISVTVSVSDDGTVEVEDNGRGVPMGWNEELGDWNWHLIYNEICLRPRDFPDKLGGIEYGFGAAAAQYASESTEVRSFDGKSEYRMCFKKGEPVGELVVIPLDESRTGTVIRFKGDPEVFTDIRIPVEYFTGLLSRAAEENRGIRFILNSGGDTVEYFVPAETDTRI